MSDRPHPYRAFSADGHVAEWAQWNSAETEQLSLSWENEAWTASGMVTHQRIQYVLRISPNWQVRQFLLFRDLEEPDLWLGTDGHGRWGEMNGEHRPDLDGCIDLELGCTPFTTTLPIRRLPLRLGHTADITVARVDIETLGIVPVRRRYTRVDHHVWHVRNLDDHKPDEFKVVEFEVDEYGLAKDYPGRFRRVS
jgi:hypothetical protein